VAKNTMTDIAIRVENLSKRYRIGRALHSAGLRDSLRSQRHDTLRDTLADTLPRILRKHNSFNSSNSWQNDHIWALKDVSFEVKRGEVVGIIGRNGAGKTTLLKILSRITEPTEGRAIIHGRVGSLLEVGTGFHPELTGRENIYLNGAILGMRRAEIDRKFDEIVAFAEIEKFMDTPVKRYSSGMYVRLAFAVAAHLEPEILLVDEVLAVGDVGFQKKCLGKMGDVASEGRTVLFVSHNLGAVQSLCPRSILLHDGMIDSEGESQKVISYYRSLFETSMGMNTGSVPADRWELRDTGHGYVLHPLHESRIINIHCGEPLLIEFSVEAPNPLHEATVGITIANASGSRVISMSSKVQRIASLKGHSRLWRVSCDLGDLPLNAGSYSVHVYFGNGIRDVARFTNAFFIRVAAYDVFGWGNSLPSAENWGPLYWAPTWTICPASSEVTR
jgi:lipopolysaccharide transport system ATP-binding protein